MTAALQRSFSRGNRRLDFSAQTFPVGESPLNRETLTPEQIAALHKVVAQAQLMATNLSFESVAGLGNLMQSVAGLRQALAGAQTTTIRAAASNLRDDLKSLQSANPNNPQLALSLSALNNILPEKTKTGQVIRLAVVRDNKLVQPVLDGKIAAESKGVSATATQISFIDQKSTDGGPTTVTNISVAAKLDGKAVTDVQVIGATVATIDAKVPDSIATTFVTKSEAVNAMGISADVTAKLIEAPAAIAASAITSPSVTPITSEFAAANATPVNTLPLSNEGQPLAQTQPTAPAVAVPNDAATPRDNTITNSASNVVSLEAFREARNEVAQAKNENPPAPAAQATIAPTTNQAAEAATVVQFVPPTVSQQPVASPQSPQPFVATIGPIVTAETTAYVAPQTTPQPIVQPTAQPAEAFQRPPESTKPTTPPEGFKQPSETQPQPLHSDPTKPADPIRNLDPASSPPQPERSQSSDARYAADNNDKRQDASYRNSRWSESTDSPREREQPSVREYIASRDTRDEPRSSRSFGDKGGSYVSADNQQQAQPQTNFWSNPSSSFVTTVGKVNETVKQFAAAAMGGCARSGGGPCRCGSAADIKGPAVQQNNASSFFSQNNPSPK